MKKIFTLLFLFAAATAVMAQGDFPVQFADKDGNIFADGTTLNLSEYEADDFGDVQVPTHLYVKNVSQSAVQVGGVYTIQSLGSGVFQTCFPVNCVQKSSLGTFETGDATMAAGELKNMQTEWFPSAEGTALVTYQLATFKQNPITKKWSIDSYGPKVTLNFTYSLTAVNSLQSSQPTRSESYYDLQGRLVAQPAHGLYVKRTVFADGTSSARKVVIR